MNHKTAAYRETYMRPREEWIELPDGVTPALVTEEAWNAVQVRLATNTGQATRNERVPYLLRGLIRCAQCGLPMWSMAEKKTLRTYRCASRAQAGGPCGGPRVRADDVEAAVWAWVEAVLNDPAIITQEVERLRLAGPDAGLVADREGVMREITRTTERIDRQMRRYRDEEDAELADLIRRDLITLQDEQRRLEGALIAVEQRIEAQDGNRRQLEAMQDYCAQVRSTLAGADFATRRLAVEALIERVDAAGTEWQWRASIPVGDLEGCAVTTTFTGGV
jgi:site-specific DNA recombinase